MEPATDRRTTIINVAMRLFAEKGYHDTTMSEIAGGAGISQALVYKLFPGKDAVYIYALERSFSEIENALLTIRTPEGSEPQVILERMEQSYRHLRFRRELLCLQMHTLAVLDRPGIRSAYLNGIEALFKLVHGMSSATQSRVWQFIGYTLLCQMTAMIEAGEEPSGSTPVLFARVFSDEEPSTGTSAEPAPFHPQAAIDAIVQDLINVDLGP